MDAVEEARLLLAEATPLKRDCGGLCGAACCQPTQGEVSGMLLFPGEERYYAHHPGFTLVAGAEGPLVCCRGECRREERPLSCRVFPLLPLAAGACVDPRARGTCPLTRYGVKGLDRAFVAAVNQAAKRLAQEPVQAAFLDKLAHIAQEYATLREMWR